MNGPQAPAGARGYFTGILRGAQGVAPGGCLFFVQLRGRRVRRLYVEPDRDRPIIDQCNGHVGPELARGHLYAQAGHVGLEGLIERCALLGGRCRRETRPVSARRISRQRELGNNQRRPARIKFSQSR